MKTSNKFLLALAFMVLLTLVGNALVLQREFNKLDLADPFYGYEKESVPDFSVIDLNGTLVGNLKIIPGDSFNIYYGKEYKDRVNWHIAGDTLKMDFVDERGYNHSRPSNFFDWNPSVYLIAPTFKYLQSRNIVSQIENFELKDLSIDVRGKQAGILLRDNSIYQLNLTSSDAAISQINQRNQLEIALIDIHLNSKLTLEMALIDSLNINYDSTSVLSMPGVLLKRMSPNP